MSFETITITRTIPIIKGYSFISQATSIPIGDNEHLAIPDSMNNLPPTSPNEAITSINPTGDMLRVIDISVTNKMRFLELYPIHPDESGEDWHQYIRDVAAAKI